MQATLEPNHLADTTKGLVVLADPTLNHTENGSIPTSEPHLNGSLVHDRRFASVPSPRHSKSPPKSPNYFHLTRRGRAGAADDFGAYPKVEVDLNALKDNCAALKKVAPDKNILIDLSFNAFGHGSIEVAGALADHVGGFVFQRFSQAADFLAVHDYPLKILITQGLTNQQELLFATEHRLDVEIHSEEEIALLEDFADGRLDVWLKKADLASHDPFGFDDAGMRNAYERLAQIDSVADIYISEAWLLPGRPGPDSPVQNGVKSGFFSLRRSRSADSGTTGIFSSLRRSFTRKRRPSIIPPAENGSSKMKVTLGSFTSGWIQPGELFYGLPNYENSDPAMLRRHGLQTALTLIGRLIHLPKKREEAEEEKNKSGKRKKQGRRAESRLGVVEIGHCDGYPTLPVKGLCCLVKGQRMAVVAGQGGRSGTVRVDLSPLTAEVGVGEEVVLWGDLLPITEMASAAGLSPLVLCSGLSASVRRVYLDERPFFPKVWSIAIAIEEEEEPEEGDEGSAVDSQSDNLGSNSMKGAAAGESYEAEAVEGWDDEKEAEIVDNFSELAGLNGQCESDETGRQSDIEAGSSGQPEKEQTPDSIDRSGETNSAERGKKSKRETTAGGSGKEGAGAPYLSPDKVSGLLNQGLVPQDDESTDEEKEAVSIV